MHCLYFNTQISPPRRQEPVRRSYSPEQEYTERRGNYREQESPKQHYYEVS